MQRFAAYVLGFCLGRVPSGNLTFYEGEHHTTKSTGDSAQRRLEDGLNRFIESLVREACRAKTMRVERERREEHRIAEAKRKEEELRDRCEIAQRDRFDTLVGQWQEAKGRREFLAALRGSIGHEGQWVGRLRRSRMV